MAPLEGNNLTKIDNEYCNIAEGQEELLLFFYSFAHYS